MSRRSSTPIRSVNSYLSIPAGWWHMSWHMSRVSVVRRCCGRAGRLLGDRSDTLGRVCGPDTEPCALLVLPDLNVAKKLMSEIGLRCQKKARSASGLVLFGFTALSAISREPDIPHIRVRACQSARNRPAIRHLRSPWSRLSTAA